MYALSRVIAIALLATSLTGCAENNYSRIETGGTVRVEAQLDPSQSILITPATDISATGKGTRLTSTVTSTIDASLSRYARLVDVAPTAYRADTTYPNEASATYGYVVVPEIMSWGGQASSYGHAAHQIKIRVTVLDAATGEKISSSILAAEAPPPNKISSLINRDSEKPGDMLTEMVNGYVDSLYGHTYFWQ